jgi:hypothetical protein
MDSKSKYSLFLGLLLALAHGASAQTSYYPYNQLEKPTAADILTYSGKPRSIIVQIVNLTPYEVRYTQPASYSVDGVPVATLGPVSDTNRFAKKSMLFAPVGVPAVIPAVPNKAFPGRPGYDSTWVNNVSRPYSMVLSWDDQDRFVERSSAFWTMKNVEYCAPNVDTGTCTSGTGDVTVGLFMSRIAPELKPMSSFFMIAKDIVSVCFQAVKIVTTGSPTAWVKAALAIKETASDAIFLARQQNEDEEGKMYVSSYALPETDLPCYTNNSTEQCQPTSSAHDDASDAAWHASWGGYPASEVVVMTQVLRGYKATIENSGEGSLGEVPVVMITLIRTTEYDTAHAVRLAQVGVHPNPAIAADILQLRRLLEDNARAGIESLRSIIDASDSEDRFVLRQLLSSITAGQPVTVAQRHRLQRLIVDLRQALNGKKKG